MKKLNESHIGKMIHVRDLASGAPILREYVGKYRDWIMCRKLNSLSAIEEWNFGEPIAELIPWTFETAPEPISLRHKRAGYVRFLQFDEAGGFYYGRHGMATFNFSQLHGSWEQLDGSPCGVKA